MAPRACITLLAVLAALFLAPWGCTIPDDPQPVCSGKTYSAYLDTVLAARLAYEKRCGLLDGQGQRDTQRRALLQLSYPSYLTEARDKSATDRRASWDPACAVEALMSASCAAGAAERALQGCAAKEVTGCLSPGRICYMHEECNGGFCKGIAKDARCGSGVCVARGGPGAACPEGAVACDPAQAHCEGGACQPLEPEGGACVVSADCADGRRCLRALAGDALGRCGSAGDGGNGAECSLVADLGRGCGAGLSCYKDAMGTYRCQPTVQMGQECTSSEACAPPLGCAKAQGTDLKGTCRPLASAGADCSADPNAGSGCQLTLSCYAPEPNQQATCQPLPETGQRCVPAQLECLTGICDAAQTPATCRPRSPGGASCRNDNDCATGLCAAGRCQTPTCK